MLPGSELLFYGPQKIGAIVTVPASVGNTEGFVMEMPQLTLGGMEEVRTIGGFVEYQTYVCSGGMVYCASRRTSGAVSRR